MATVSEVVSAIGAQKPSSFTAGDMYGWLTSLDRMIEKEILSTHECDADVSALPYTSDNTEAELLAPPPYDMMYHHWLCAQIDMRNGEITKFNNSMALFSSVYSAFFDWFNRTHTPKGVSNVKLWGVSP